MQKKICAVYEERAVIDWIWPTWFTKFLGTIDILAKEFFAVGLCYSLEDV